MCSRAHVPGVSRQMKDSSSNDKESAAHSPRRRHTHGTRLTKKKKGKKASVLDMARKSLACSRHFPSSPTELSLAGERDGKKRDGRRSESDRVRE